MQQINLYCRSAGRSETAGPAGRRVLAARTVTVTLGLVIVTLTGLSFFGHWRLLGLDRQLGALRTQQTEQLAMLERAGSLVAGKTPAHIDQHIKTLTGTIARRDDALRALESGAAGSAQGFAGRLEGLARGHLDGLWLVRMSIESRDRALALTGNARDADLVPRYLESLARQPVFSGTRFGHLSIERDQERSSVRFEVATVAPVAQQAGS